MENSNGLILGLAKLMQDNPSPTLIVFCFAAVLMFSNTARDIIHWIKGRKKDSAEVNSLNAKSRMEEFSIHEKNKQDFIAALMQDMANMKAYFESQKADHKNEMKELKEEVSMLKIEIQKLNDTVHNKINDNFRLEATVKLKNHEIAQLRNWITAAIKKICAACKSQMSPVPAPVPESIQEKASES